MCMQIQALQAQNEKHTREQSEAKVREGKEIHGESRLQKIQRGDAKAQGKGSKAGERGYANQGRLARSSWPARGESRPAVSCVCCCCALAVALTRAEE